MGVVSAEAKGRHGSPERPVPGFGAAHWPEGQARENRVGRVQVQGGRPRLVGERAQHLQEPRDACHRDEVAQVALEGANGHGPVAEDAGGALELRGIAHRGSRCVALEQTEVTGGDPGLVPRGTQGPFLARDQGGEEAAAAPVVGQAHAANHPVDGVAFGKGVLQALEHHEGGPFCRDQSVGVGMEGPGAAGLGHGLQGTEAHVDEQVVCAVHRTREGHVRPAVVQPVARELDGVPVSLHI